MEKAQRNETVHFMKKAEKPLKIFKRMGSQHQISISMLRNHMFGLTASFYNHIDTCKYTCLLVKKNKRSCHLQLILFIHFCILIVIIMIFYKFSKLYKMIKKIL